MRALTSSLAFAAVLLLLTSCKPVAAQVSDMDELQAWRACEASRPIRNNGGHLERYGSPTISGCESISRPQLSGPPQLSQQAKQACSEQAVANGLGDQQRSQRAGQQCTW